MSGSIIVRSFIDVNALRNYANDIEKNIEKCFWNRGKDIGFEVVKRFTSARRALEYIKREKVDVVMTDIKILEENE